MDKRAMHDLKDMLCKEIDKIAKKGELSAGSLETVHKLTDTVKNIDKIMMLEDDEDDGYSERGRRRDSMGRYSRDDGMDYGRGGNWMARGQYGGMHSYDDGGSSYADRGRGGRMYSRDDGRKMIEGELEDLMRSADDRDKEIIRRALNELRRA